MASQGLDPFGWHGNLDPFGERRTLKGRARGFAATLKQSNTVRLVWAAILLAVWVGAIVLSLVTGEGSGPG